MSKKDLKDSIEWYKKYRPSYTESSGSMKKHTNFHDEIESYKGGDWTEVVTLIIIGLTVGYIVYHIIRAII